MRPAAQLVRNRSFDHSSSLNHLAKRILILHWALHDTVIRALAQELAPDIRKSS